MLVVTHKDDKWPFWACKHGLNIKDVQIPIVVRWKYHQLLCHTTKHYYYQVGIVANHVL